jgi:hypothetical protein
MTQGLMNEGGAQALGAALAAGLINISYDDEITFQEYSRVVLPIDGYIFWKPVRQFTVQGSLHVSQDIVINEDETLGLASVIFSVQRPIVQFSESPINSLFVATFNDESGSANVNGMRYVFGSQQIFKQAELWHYSGHSVEPAMATQLLDTPGLIDPTQAIVSNSLPLWLSLNDYESPYPDGFSNSIPLYPSFITPPNLIPAYGAVHIGEDDTEALQAIPLIDSMRNSWQLVADTVTITLYGTQNNAASDLVNCIINYSANYPDTFGIMNMPVIRDCKRMQNEMLSIAMKKKITFRVSYYQTRIANIARVMIEKCIPTFIFEH